MWLWLIKNVNKSLDEIPLKSWNVKDSASQQIPRDFVLHTTEVVEKFESIKGDTTKLLIKLQDGHQIETVIMKHSGRNTVCVSSQVGRFVLYVVLFVICFNFRMFVNRVMMLYFQDVRWVADFARLVRWALLVT